MHGAADLLQIADILLGKVLFNGVEHKPCKREKSQNGGEADKERQAQSQGEGASGGLTLHPEDLIPARLTKALPTIHAVFAKIGASKLAPAHAALKGKFTYDDLRIARLAFAG